ncbi:DUF5638 domain-containing protein [Legionella anisa]|uniref:DUF5638 domain-containing protein n=1 Tax=Legionella anisa TaxID=28082 RepID=A0AAX0WRS1_9GAMM|nr:DUF5638 domain-containing protein [Legionella anisa]AWN75078.1 hypothetical protein DLD14_15210 [Legionella anisa]KTC69215.1 hypothetical protein Lani_2708 [Legionella anisa]MBN5934416.1 hypothetical protein [Legionella anisa]MCW8424715.1 DUF5638 domain-containing protein [Legionella anisa]MCW8446166.1 DUF5638 domain-containing protein [Legionella anisa]
MPLNQRKLERRLETCDEALQALFADQDVGEKINKQIIDVQEYYNLSYTKTNSAKKAEKIAASYELFIDQLTKVKNKQLNPKEASEKISNSCESRKIGVLFHNLAKACELMFYAATAFSLYAGIFGIALPVLIVQPVLGVAVGITIVGAMIAAAYKALSCFTEFKSFSRHDTEYTNELSLVSFFKPKLQPIKEDLQHSEEDELEINYCC